MALWGGIVGEANTRAAMAFNTVLTEKVVFTLAQHRPFFRMLWGGIPRAAGNQAVGALPGVLRFQKVTYVKGNQYELQMMARLDDWTFLGDGNDEIALVTGSVQTDDVARFTWDLAHAYKKEWLPNSDVMSIRGDAVKSEQYVDMKIRKLGEELARFCNTRLFGNTNQSRGSILGLQYAIAADNTYGVNRSTAGNESFQSQVANFTGGALNLDEIDKQQNLVSTYNGDGECGFVGTTVFSYLRHELREHNTVMVQSDYQKDAFGGSNNKYVRFGPTDFYHDGACGNNYLYILSFGSGDLPAWKWVMGEDPLISTGVLVDKVNRAAAGCIPAEFWGGLFCAVPAAQGRLGNSGSAIAAPSAWAA